MTIQGLGAPQQPSLRSAAAAPTGESAPRDTVELGAGPRLMAGVPTGYLVPEIPPPNLYTTTVGVEIIPGLGISLDGKALLVGHKSGPENLSITGHLEDGTFPQRDFKVSHQGNSTTVDGYYDWQDYRLTDRGGNLQVEGGDNDQNVFTTSQRPDGFDINSRYSGRTFHVTYHGNSAEVKCGYQQGPNFTVTQNGNQTVVDRGNPDYNYTLTRQADGTITVDGKLKPQDFTISNGADGLVVQGYYPQQHYVIRAA